MFNYKTNNLYIGLLGIVTGNCYNLKITSRKKCIIYKKVVLDKFATFKDYGAKDVFSGKIYYFFEGNHFPRNTIEKAIGGYAIMRSFPIEQFLDFSKKEVTKDELLTILDKLNNPDKQEKKEEPTEPITDSILKTILETSDLVKVSNISDELKEKTIKELEKLAEDYVKDLERFNNKSESNPLESEYHIRMTYIKALVDIEQKINDPKEIKSYSLKKQLNQFKKELNSND